MSSRRKLRRVVLRQRRLLSASPGKGPARYAVICSVALGNNVFARLGKRGGGSPAAVHPFLDFRVATNLP
jgi:predicted short-subunit dehydrogenase-like oxidoreductase (DUF2520 family)